MKGKYPTLRIEEHAYLDHFSTKISKKKVVQNARLVFGFGRSVYYIDLQGEGEFTREYSTKQRKRREEKMIRTDWDRSGLQKARNLGVFSRVLDWKRTFWVGKEKAGVRNRGRASMSQWMKVGKKRDKQAIQTVETWHQQNSLNFSPSVWPTLD